VAVQYDSTPRAVADSSNVAVTLGVASLGGTVGVRVIVDDLVVTSKDAALRHLDTVMMKIEAGTWPPSS